MKCPFCSHIESKVLDSRLSKEMDTIRRRRECLKCGKRFSTAERLEEGLPLVVKKDGRREVFDRAKILGGLKRACEKRASASSRFLCRSSMPSVVSDQVMVQCISFHHHARNLQNNPLHYR